jgi:hypothetical protein
MSRKRVLLLIAFCLPLLSILFWVLTMQTPQPHVANLLLKVVRQKTQGQPVAFFRILGAEEQQIDVSSAVILSADHRFGEPDKRIRLGRVLDSSGRVWQALPLRNSTISRSEFGVLAPTNCQAWHLRVTVKVKESLRERFYSSCASFKSTLDAGANFTTALQFAWSDPHEGYTTIQSDLVTNGAPSSATGN